MAEEPPVPYVPPAPVPYFDGQVKVGDEDQQLPEDPKAWFPNELKVFANGEKVHESLFANHNADIRLECDGASLIGRVDPGRGPAQKVEASAPLEMKEEEEEPEGPALLTVPIIHRRLGLKIAEPLQLDVDGALTLDPAFQPGGEVPPTVAFRAHKNGVNQTGLLNSGYTKLTFGFEDYDRGNYFDTATSRWTPPAGLVHIDVGVWIASGVTTNSYILSGIYKNGVVLKQGVNVTSATNGGSQCSVDDIASGTDYYEFWVWTAGASCIAAGDTVNTFFSGHVPSGQQGEQGPIGLTGATGPQGLQGIQGIQGSTGLTGATGPQGSQGIPGPQGVTGPQGSQGDPGTPGSVWHQASGAPGAALGIVGDFYLNTADGNVYRKTGASVWTVVGNIKGPQGLQGAQGATGAQGPVGPIGPAGPQGVQGEIGPIGPPGPATVWRNGYGVPSNSLGFDGDYYLDDATGNVYFRSGGAYSVVANIIGPPGGMAEAPTDGQIYGRQNAAWTPVVVSGYLPLTGGTLTGNLIISKSNVAELHLNALDNTNKNIRFFNNNSERFTIQVNSAAEGADFRIHRYDDAGAWLGYVVSINRSTGEMKLTGALTMQSDWPQLSIQKNAAGQGALISGRTGTSVRWLMQLGDGAAESGANSGSNFIINRYDDAGALIDSPLTINRATGSLSLTKPLANALFTHYNTTNIGSAAAANTGAIEIQGGADTGYNASISFHVTGSFACHFGLANDGNFYMGGWSHGATAYRFWTTRDFTSTPFPTTGGTMTGSLTTTGSLTASSGIVWGYDAGGGADYNNLVTGGVYELNSAANGPPGYTWSHTWIVRHSNPTSVYAWQFAADFFTDQLYYRRVTGGSWGTWKKFWTTNDFTGTPYTTSGGTISGVVTAYNFIATQVSSYALQTAAWNVGNGYINRVWTGNPSWGEVSCYVQHLAGSWVRIRFLLSSNLFDFDHNGSAWKPAGGQWADISDSRIKTVLRDYGSGLAAIEQLRPVVYKFKGNDTDTLPSSVLGTSGMERTTPDPNAVPPYRNSFHYQAATAGTEYIGLTAQECETAMPELVTRRTGFIDGQQVDDLRNLDSTPLTFALINAVKELSAKVNALEARVAQLEGAPA